MTREFHEVADIFPLISGPELDALAKDIKENGLRIPILLHPNGSIIDGRNRYRACRLADIEPRFETWDGKGSLVTLVVSLNLKRRHLDESQRGMVAGRALPLFQEEARQRMSEGAKGLTNLSDPEKGNARDKAGEAFMISGMTVQHATKVLREGVDELIAAVDKGDVAVSTAAVIAELPEKEQREVVSRGREQMRKEAERQTTQKRRENQQARAQLAAKTVELPKGQFHCIVIDPPWQMEKIERDERPKQVGFDYPAMNEAQLRALPVQRLAFKHCHLYLWTTHKHLPLAFELAKEWGFTYECLMTWVKNVGFTPYSWMRSTEHVLFCRRGKLDLRKQGVRLDFSAKVREHSRKPEVFYDLVRDVSPGPRLDMFSREERDGFEGWGNEADKFKSSKS